ncbi:MAG: efflux RND transporter periplasmic adaptor subunit [Pseudomonadota bacterium]|nr:efflux RND transporter periplasmic adaptor subunit [Pseudomonadota bacterium]
MRILRHSKAVAALLLLLSTLALTGCGKPAKDAGGKPAAAALAASAPVLLLSPEDLRTVEPGLLASGPVVTGSVQPQRKADLRAEVAAIVTQVYKENGEAVKTGDLLMRLDETAIRDSLISADAAVRASAESFDQSERQVQRMKTLQAQGMMSMQALDDAQMRRSNAQSDLVAARGRAVTARQQLRRTEIRAPFDGLVSERQASVGDTVQVGRELVKVIDPRSMRFEGLVSSDQLQSLKLGEAVSFRVNGMGDTDYAGTVKRIDAAANATTRQVEVIIDFNDPAKAPRVAGLFAEGRIATGGTQALLLPEGAISRAGDQAWVWRVDEGAGGKKISKVAVKLGPRDSRSGQFPVLSGLQPGDRILRSPGDAVVDGQGFEIAKPPATASAASASQAAVAAK